MITIKGEHASLSEPEDVCAETLDCQDAAELCLAQADALPDGTPEQLGVLLRGLLASQLGMVRMTIVITEKLDAWPQTHGEWHAEHPGARCADGDRCESR
jgi:hypothetical protein